MRAICLSRSAKKLALLTGDRTLVDVVVHEATHSWFGNGIT
jgi:aminopeptidase N